MNIKISCHVMPWDIDYALLTFSQLKKSKYYLPNDVNITIDTELNLSNYIINWDDSKIKKDFFIDKFNTLLLLLSDYNVVSKIYEGDDLYGHLNHQRNMISDDTDYYISLCPDIYFSEYALLHLIESARQIENKYFVVTPQISKVGDSDWDVLTNSNFIDIPYSDYLKVNIFDIRHINKHNPNDKKLVPINKSKWAGWFDLYSKDFYEELCPFLDEWNGYGPWDHYSIIVSTVAQQNGVDFQQYILEEEIIWMYPTGDLLDDNTNGFTKYYRDRIQLNNIPNQRIEFEKNLSQFISKTLKQLEDKNIIQI